MCGVSTTLSSARKSGLKCGSERAFGTHQGRLPQELPFDDLRFLVRGQFVKHLAQMLPQHSEDAFLPPLGYKYHVIFAVPSRMAQALLLFHCESPFSWQRSEIHADRRKGQTLVSPPA